MPERLADKLKNNTGLIASLVKLGTQDYFDAIASLLNDEHFENVYRGDIPGDNDAICKVLYEASQSPSKYKILHRILIEPLVKMKGVNCYDNDA